MDRYQILEDLKTWLNERLFQEGELYIFEVQEKIEELENYYE